MSEPVRLSDIPPTQGDQAQTLSSPVVMGRLTAQWTVWCGACSGWLYVSGRTVTDAARSAVRSGWRKSRKLGWLCPGDHTETGDLK
jgi:hypothetical protein